MRVLDHGFVDLLNVDGDDYTVLEAARVSTGAQARKGDEKDRKLIRYLMKNHHHSPFEMIDFKFHIKLPIFVMRQLVRHRVSSLNEMSGRYRELPTTFYVPSEWRKQDTKNKQGSAESFSNLDSDMFLHKLFEAYSMIEETYSFFLEQGVARELARIVLPVSTYTEIYWKINFRSLMNFLHLRLDEHAQWEIRQYAQAIDKLLSEHDAIKWAYEAFKELYPIK